MLREHDVPTYKQLEAMLIEHGECCLIGIPGVGKTRISMHFAEKYNLNVLVITPRTEINNRWQYWGSKTDKGSISTITIQNFYTAYSMFVDGIDLYIFDECHCLGAKKWGKSYDKFKKLIDKSECYIIGLTATPNRYFDEGYAVNNVGETVFDSHIVYCMDREKAISLGLIGRSKYVCALYDVGELKREYSKKKMTEELRGRLDYAFKNQPQIRDILIKHAPQNSPMKGIVYVDKIDSIDDGINIIRMAFPEEKIWYVHSKMSKSKCNRICKEFEESESGFIVNVDILSEGVHYDGVNIIVMLRKTFSPTKFTQQTGRVNNTKESIIFDFAANNVSVADTLSRIEISKIEFAGNDASREISISNQEIVADYVSDFLTILQDIDSYNSGSWTTEEDNILINYYPDEGSDVSKRLHGRTKCACNNRAYALGLNAIKYWTEEEDDIIRKYYPIEGQKVAERLPGRTKGACCTRAHNLGIEGPASTKWTKEEDEILRKYYPIEGQKVAERLPGRTSYACHQRFYKFCKSIISFWSKAEDEILLKYYPIEGQKVAERLPGRTKGACSARANILGIEAPPSTRWTTEEDDIIRKYYPIEGQKVAERLPGRSISACQQRANKFGLKLEYTGIWTDYEIQIFKEYYLDEGPDVYKRIPNKSEKQCVDKAHRLKLVLVPNWTEDEDNILYKYYPIEGGKVSERLPGRNPRSCFCRANALNIKFINNDRWTEEEDDIIRKYYPIEGGKVSERLPGRNDIGCQQRAGKLGVKRILNNWTEDEDNIILQYYPTEGAKVIKRLPGRTESACKSRADKLGVKRILNNWTEDEDNIIRQYYPTEGGKVSERLHRRSDTACRCRAKVLNVKREIN